MAKKNLKKKKKKSEEKFLDKHKGLLLIIILIGVVVVFVGILNTFNTNPPRVTKECCDNWCAKGNMECHRYTRDYVMCRIPEEQANEGITPVIDFWIYNRTQLCDSDMELLTGVKQAPYEGNGEVKGEVSVSIK